MGLLVGQTERKLVEEYGVVSRLRRDTESGDEICRGQRAVVGRVRVLCRSVTRRRWFALCETLQQLTLEPSKLSNVLFWNETPAFTVAVAKLEDNTEAECVFRF